MKKLEREWTGRERKKKDGMDKSQRQKREGNTNGLKEDRIYAVYWLH